MSLDAAIADLKASGYLLNNLFQLDDGTWRANVRCRSGCHEFGDAPTAEEAVRRALAKTAPSQPAARGDNVFE